MSDGGPIRLPAAPTALMWAALLVAATLGNGALSYLHRIGVLDPEGYAQQWTAHCYQVGVSTEWQCGVFTSPGRIWDWLHVWLPAPESQYVFAVPGGWVWLKLLKDGLWAMLLVSPVFVSTPAMLPSSRVVIPSIAFAAQVIIGFVVCWITQGALVAAAGLRMTEFLWLGVSARWLIPKLAVFAEAVAVLMVAQLVAAPVELLIGAHLSGEWSRFTFAHRIAGLLNQPNSLGIFAVTGWTFCYAFLQRRGWLLPLAGVAVALVLLSGSATGVMCIVVLAAFAMSKWTGGRSPKRVAALGLLVAASAFFLLPQLTGRADVFASIGERGRAAAFVQVIRNASARELVLGRGLGVGSNSALGVGLAADGAGEWQLASAPTDSEFVGLIAQLGLLGAALFYWMLWRLMATDQRARCLYVTLALCSLTGNILEMFPVNLMLGLAMAHSIWHGTPSNPSRSNG
jgi:hypothetical protein